MPRRKAGERILGPYQHHAAWRVIHVHPGIRLEPGGGGPGKPGQRTPVQITARRTISALTREDGDSTVFEVGSEEDALALSRLFKRKVAPGVRTAGDALTKYLEREEEEGNTAKDLEHKRQSFALLLDEGMLLDELVSEERCEAIYDAVRRRAQPRTAARCSRAAVARGETSWPKHDRWLNEDRGFGLPGCLCKRYAVDTHRNALSEVKTFLQYCVRSKWIKASGFEKIKGVGKRKKGIASKKQLTVDEAKKFIVVCLRAAGQGDQGAVAGLMTLLMGMRTEEINSRVVRNVDKDGTILWITGKTEAGTRSGKIPPILRPFIRDLCVRKAPTDSLWDYSRNGTGSGRARGKIINALRDAAPMALTPAQLAERIDVGLNSIYVIASRLARLGIIGRGGRGEYRHFDITPSALTIRRPARGQGRPQSAWVLRAVKRLCAEAGVVQVTAHSNRGLQQTLKTIGGLDRLLDQIAQEAGHTDKGVTKDHYIAPQALADAGQDTVLSELGYGAPDAPDDPNLGVPDRSGDRSDSGNETLAIIPGADLRKVRR
jgi:integrase